MVPCLPISLSSSTLKLSWSCSSRYSPPLQHRFPTCLTPLSSRATATVTQSKVRHRLHELKVPLHIVSSRFTRPALLQGTSPSSETTLTSTPAKCNLARFKCTLRCSVHVTAVAGKMALRGRTVVAGSGDAGYTNVGEEGNDISDTDPDCSVARPFYPSNR